MRIVYTKKFQKLKSRERKKFGERMEIFTRNQFDILLHDHALHGDLFCYRGINITGDVRVLYEQVQRDVVLFVDIDTHSNLYA